MAMRRSAPFSTNTFVGDLGPVPGNIKSVNVIVITASGERILSQIDWMPSMTCNFVSARPARIAPGPAAVGTFSVNLAPGSYSITLSNCDSSRQALGCRGLPWSFLFPLASMLGLIFRLTPGLDSFHLMSEPEASFHNNARDKFMSLTSSDFVFRIL